METLGNGARRAARNSTGDAGSRAGARLHPDSTRLRFPQHTTIRICPCCGASARLIRFGRFGDSPARCSACGFRAARCAFHRLGQSVAPGGAP